MADAQETTADIIAEMRALSNPISDGIIAINGRQIADRIEAAWKRKLSDFNPKGDWSVQEALDFANTLANHGWTREANSDAASSCIYGLCRLLKELGNAAKLREALGKLRAELWNNTVIAGKRKFELYEIADAALSAPPRNCDVGTAEEQSKRKMEFCYNQGGCFNCPFGKSETLTLCALAWTQMPYKEGGAK